MRIGTFAAAALALIVGANAPAQAQMGLEAVAASGEQAPGTDPGVVFDLFSLPVINAAGEVAFLALLTGPGVDTTNDEGIFGADANGMLSLIARERAQAPGTDAGVVFNGLSDPVINAAGEVAFVALLTGPGVDLTNENGIFGADANGMLRLIARGGDQAPGTDAGVVFYGFNDPVINAAGEVAFVALLTGPGVSTTNNNGIFGPDANGMLRLIAREDDQAPGTAPGGVFNFFGTPVINAAGEVAFFAFLTGPGVDRTNNSGIFGTDANGMLSLILREGTQAPGTDTGVVFNGFGDPVINAAGEVAFRAFLTGAGVDTTNDEGIFGPDANGMLSLIAREGDQAPGTAQGVVFGFFENPVLNASGEVAFRASLTGTGVDTTNEEGIFGADANGMLRLIARAGYQAPGTAQGVVFLFLDDPVLNAAGEVAFRASLTGTGVDTTNEEGIFGPAANGMLSLIAREGETFTLPSGTLKTFSTFFLTINSGNEDGRPSGFSDNGQTAFGAQFVSGAEAVLVSVVDQDGDGVRDGDDNCPNSPALGAPVTVSTTTVTPQVDNRLTTTTPVQGVAMSGLGCTIQDIFNQAVASPDPCSSIALRRSVAFALRSLRQGNDLTPQETAAVRAASITVQCP